MYESFWRQAPPAPSAQQAPLVPQALHAPQAPAVKANGDAGGVSEPPGGAYRRFHRAYCRLYATSAAQAPARESERRP